MRLDIVIAGVGGQGTVLASRVIAQTAMKAGCNVRTSETIGMAQREGTVTSHVRIGDPLYGGIIPDHGADVLLGFELAESVRWLYKLKSEGRAYVNTARIVPVSVASGRSVYDTNALDKHLRNTVRELFIFDAQAIANEAGSFKTTNTVLLGALSTMTGLPFTAQQLLDEAMTLIPARVRDINQKAFELGRKAMEVY
ncbi:MAG TPA: indolepyruvate oxidoreductase subunit beta [Desulfobacteria bacterium]|nr:indolepyruvate oxidoreductase subunit beta [Desulfobacteria bacterium]